MAGRRVAVLADGGGHGSIAAAESERHGLTLPELSAELRALAASRPAGRGRGLEPGRSRRRRRAGRAHLRPGRARGARLRRDRRAARDRLLRRLRRVRAGGRGRGAAGRGDDLRGRDGDPPPDRRPHDVRRRGRRRGAARGGRAGLRDDRAGDGGAAPAGATAGGPARSRRCPSPPRRSGRRRPTTTTRARELLAAGGVPFVASRTVGADADDVLAAADELGYPVALKALGQLHKSDAGGVVLGLRDAVALRAAHAELGNGCGTERFSVERMAPIGDGAELLIGARWDPRLGPIALAGAGGLYAEVLGDSAVALAPVDRRERARALIASLRIAPLLTRRPRPAAARSRRRRPGAVGAVARRRRPPRAGRARGQPTARPAVRRARARRPFRPHPRGELARWTSPTARSSWSSATAPSR